MKLFILLMAILSVSLVGCGSSTTTSQGMEPAKVEQTATAPEEKEEVKEEAKVEDGTLGDYKVEFGEAQVVESSYGDGDLLEVTYNFTNNSEEAKSADVAVILTAYQDGVEMEKAFDVQITGENHSKNVKKGVGLECKALFKLTSKSPVEVEAEEFLGDGSKIEKTYTV